MVEKKRRKVIIGLETAVNGGSISLVENRKEIDWIGGREYFSRSDDLLNGLEKLLVKNDIGRNDIEKICVSKGPGSLTGIRIGTALALGIGNALQKEVFEISILDALKVANPTPGKVMTAFYFGEELVYFKEFAENNEVRRTFKGEVSQTKLVDFAKNMSVFATEGNVSYVLTDKLVRAIKEELSVTNFLENSGLNIIQVFGSFARIIAIGGS